MTIKQIERGQILNTKCDIIVTTVNCVGIMGKGIAKTLRLLDSSNGLYPNYVYHYHSGKENLGRLYLYQGLSRSETWKKSTLLFPTKVDWRNPSKIEYIEEGLQSLVARRIKFSEGPKPIKSMAFPLLGGGLGGLDKNEVLDLMYKHLSRIDTLEFEIYEALDPYATDGLVDVLKNRVDQIDLSKANKMLTEKLHNDHELLPSKVKGFFESLPPDSYLREKADMNKSGVQLTSKQLSLVSSAVKQEECTNVEKLLKVRGINEETLKKCFQIILDDELFEKVKIPPQIDLFSSVGNHDV